MLSYYILKDWQLFTFPADTTRSDGRNCVFSIKLVLFDKIWIEKATPVDLRFRYDWHV